MYEDISDDIVKLLKKRKQEKMEEAERRSLLWNLESCLLIHILIIKSIHLYIQFVILFLIVNLILPPPLLLLQLLFFCCFRVAY